MINAQIANDSALGDIRILDLTGPIGGYSTKLLADLGADVIIVEPPEGHSARRFEPFYHDEKNPEKSLYFFQYHTNKRSVVLDLATREGQDAFKKLVRTSDMLFETFQPGYLDSLGLGYGSLSEINPQLVVVSITPYGQTGPYKDFKGCDLTGLATSGVLSSCGYPDDPPTAFACSQAYHMVSTNAAIGALMALSHRDCTGEGQCVDVSMQGSLLRVNEIRNHTYWIRGNTQPRSGAEFFKGIKDLFKCKDGYVFCSALGGSGAPIMLEWMKTEGKAADLLDEEYQEAINMIMLGTPLGKGSQQKVRIDEVAARMANNDLQQQRKHIEEVWAEFLSTHTKQELFVGAQERGVRLQVENRADELLQDPALIERNFFTEVFHPELGASLSYFGPPYRLSETPVKITRRPPLMGEHNAEIFQHELGLNEQELVNLNASKLA